MTSISGFIDGILDGVIPPEKHHYYLQIVSGEIHRLSRLVTSLLDLSRIQAGERKFTPVQFDVCETARQILISFEQKIDAKRLEVEFECDEDKMIAIADHDAIYQVLYNLCDNAVKFASDGGLLAVRLKYAKGRKITVEIFNEGQGISQNDINYVFERFYKSDKSRGLNKNGAGLGLFIAKTIIDAHGGRIWVESEYGKNCCFAFEIDGE
jgi:signal transduction histidine kinase